MKLALATLLLLSLNQTVSAETIGKSGFMFGPPENDEVAAPAPAPSLPMVREANAAVRTAPAPTTNVQPAQVTMSGDTRCPDPQASPDAKNTPVEVIVDQQAQTITIHTPDRATDLVDKVSTGGGLKIPNGSIQKSPYCARTPRIEKIISAVKEDSFKNTNCTADEKRAKSTVFPMYYTRTFTDKNGRPVPMPKAIRIDGGIFFHEVPPSYKGLLGHNVSGECVRLTPSTAAFLQKQINKYGAIKVKISEPPQIDPDMPQYCDAQMVAQAKMDKINGSTSPSAQATGSEDVVGGVESFQTIMGKILDPFGIFRGQAQQQPRPSQAVGRRS